ncbi:MAG: Rne/Rng family ribonuclease [Planctomycetes bacterium]|nr:Rne/Rng family ribonuclease [Planctomycetota bacterium]
MTEHFTPSGDQPSGSPADPRGPTGFGFGAFEDPTLDGPAPAGRASDGPVSDASPGDDDDALPARAGEPEASGDGETAGDGAAAGDGEARPRRRRRGGRGRRRGGRAAADDAPADLSGDAEAAAVPDQAAEDAAAPVSEPLAADGEPSPRRSRERRAEAGGEGSPERSGRRRSGSTESPQPTPPADAELEGQELAAAPDAEDDNDLPVDPATAPVGDDAAADGRRSRRRRGGRRRKRRGLTDDAQASGGVSEADAAPQADADAAESDVASPAPEPFDDDFDIPPAAPAGPPEAGAPDQARTGEERSGRRRGRRRGRRGRRGNEATAGAEQRDTAGPLGDGAEATPDAEGETSPEAAAGAPQARDDRAPSERKSRRGRRRRRGGAQRLDGPVGVEWIPGEEDDLEALDGAGEPAAQAEPSAAPSAAPRSEDGRRGRKEGKRGRGKEREEADLDAGARPKPGRPNIILVNAADREEIRVAVVEGGQIVDFQMHVKRHETLVNDIYRGKVVNLEPAIGAAFIDFGEGRNGFLHTSDVLSVYGEPDWRLDKLLTHKIDPDEWDEKSSQPHVSVELAGRPTRPAAPAQAPAGGVEHDEHDEHAHADDESDALHAEHEGDGAAHAHVHADEHEFGFGGLDDEHGHHHDDHLDADHPHDAKDEAALAAAAEGEGEGLELLELLDDGHADGGHAEPPHAEVETVSLRRPAPLERDASAPHADAEGVSAASDERAEQRDETNSAGSRERGRFQRGKRGGKPGGERGKDGGRHGRPRARPRLPITDLLEKGQSVVVQVTKDAIGDKGPTLTTYISIPGRYLVLMPSMSRTGVSRKIEDEKERRRLKRILESLDVPEGMGVIVRTAGTGCTREDLRRDLDYLMLLWDTFGKRLNLGRGPAPLYEESDVAIRTIRDLFNDHTEAVYVDDERVYQRVREFMEKLIPEKVDRVQLHTGPKPLFHTHNVEQDFERIFARRIDLPSGGSIVLDQTEALVAIDVNSGKTRSEGFDFENIALRTNLDAVKEIARQIRLRDLGGIIVCDFIDMQRSSSRRQVERALHDAIESDRARSKLGRISQFGLLELTRQRLGPGLSKMLFTNCPRCRGSGRIRTVESRAGAILRRLGAALTLKGFHKVEVRAAPEVVEHLRRYCSSELKDLEARHERQIELASVTDQLEDSVLRYLRADGREVRPGGRRKR